jgi:preprotein translocase subunit SecG
VINTIVIVLHVIFASALVLFILLHRGTGGGLSDMFGGGMGGLQGSAVVERNLDRLTVAAVIGLTITDIILVMRLV